MSQFKPLPPIQELQQVFDYDPVTGIFRNKYTRSSRAVKGAVAGKLRQDGYISLTYKRRQMPAARVAWYVMTGVDPMERLVDHRDRVRNNNSFQNLRLCTQRQNTTNRLAKGWCVRIDGHYDAQILVDRSIIWLGRFNTPEEAHEVYVAKHVEIHGEFSPYRATLMESNT
jgi:hypothetical protein